MSMDFEPIPGLPLLSELYCNVTTVKKKTVATCSFPNILYTKKSIYGGIPGSGIGAVEVFLILIFLLLSIKMKHDVTKNLLTIIYIPLGFSAIFKVACGVYGTVMGAYGWFYMVFLMFYNFFYTCSILCVSMGSVLYLSALIIITRKRKNIASCNMWNNFFAILFISLLLSASYHFVAQKYNQLPASAIFFTYFMCTIVVVIELLVSLCVGFMCHKPPMHNDELLESDDPVAIDARTRLGFGALFVLIININVCFEIYVKITELFTPYLWNGDNEKKIYYRGQAVELMTLDIVRIFMSLIVLAGMFISSSGRYAIVQWIHHSENKKKGKKVFVENQQQPLLMDTGDKKQKEHEEGHKKEHHHDHTPPPVPAPSPVVSTITPTDTIKNEPDKVSTPVPHPMTQMAPPQYGQGMSFAPGMVQFPHNMQTTIVYTPAMATAYTNGYHHPPP